MITGLKIRVGAVLLALAAAPTIRSQTANGTDSRANALVSSGRLVSETARGTGEPLREIVDPTSGDRWVLVRDWDHPGGPGRLELVAIGRLQKPGTALGVAELQPVIRAGDRLVIEENSAVAVVRLEAVALGKATVGSSLNVRLKIGGRVVRVVALAPGRAAFPSQSEVRP